MDKNSFFDYNMGLMAKPEDQSNYMTARTRAKLEKIIPEQHEKVARLKVETGKAQGDGDGWHSSTGRILTTETDNARNMLEHWRAALEGAELIEAPTDDDIVRLGHMVQVFFINDPDEDPTRPLLAHVLGAADVAHITGDLKNEPGKEEMITSTISPFGQAVLGLARGEVGSFRNPDGHVTEIKVGTGPDAITVSYLLDDEGEVVAVEMTDSDGIVIEAPEPVEAIN